MVCFAGKGSGQKPKKVSGLQKPEKAKRESLS